MTAVSAHVIAAGAEPPATAEPAARPNAGGTMWRLRSLVAMGHDATRIATALQVDPKTIQALLRGEAATVTPELRDLACQLWDAWWDKHPPERTREQRRAAAIARRCAERNNWCPPLGLDEEQLDEPGYRPYSRYRPATGAGPAGEFRPVVRPGKSAALANDELTGRTQEPRAARNLARLTLADDRSSIGNPILPGHALSGHAVTARCGPAGRCACARSSEPST